MTLRHACSSSAATVPDLGPPPPDWGSHGLDPVPSTPLSSHAQEAKRGPGGAAVFIARNRFAVLDKASNQILVKNLRNEVTRQTPCPLPVTDNIFYAGTGLLLCRSDEKVGAPPGRLSRLGCAK